jgi:hypothetical protein
MPPTMAAITVPAPAKKAVEARMICSFPLKRAAVPMFRRPGPEPCLNGGIRGCPMNMAVAKPVPEAKLQPPPQQPDRMDESVERPGPFAAHLDLARRRRCADLWRLQDALPGRFQVRRPRPWRRPAPAWRKPTRGCFTDLHAGRPGTTDPRDRQRFPDTEIMVISILGDEEA